MARTKHKASAAWADTKPAIWDRVLGICSGCNSVIPNDDRMIVDGIHRIIYCNSDGEPVVDNPCGEVAVYRFDRTLAPSPRVKAPAPPA